MARAEVINFLWASLHVVTLKGALRKGKRNLVEGILSSGPYLDVQTLGVRRAVILSNAEAATHNSCVLITGREAGYYSKGIHQM